MYPTKMFDINLINRKNVFFVFNELGNLMPIRH